MNATPVSNPPQWAALEATPTGGTVHLVPAIWEPMLADYGGKNVYSDIEMLEELEGRARGHALPVAMRLLHVAREMYATLDKNVIVFTENSEPGRMNITAWTEILSPLPWWLNVPLSVSVTSGRTHTRLAGPLTVVTEDYDGGNPITFVEEEYGPLSSMALSWLRSHLARNGLRTSAGLPGNAEVSGYALGEPLSAQKFIEIFIERREQP